MAGALLLTVPLSSIALAFLLAVLIFVLRVLVRSTAAATALACVVAVATPLMQGEIVSAVMTMLVALPVALTLTRFGLVAAIAFLAANRMADFLRLAFAWNPTTGAFVILCVVSLVMFAAYLAMGSPRILPRASAPSRST